MAANKKDQQERIDALKKEERKAKALMGKGYARLVVASGERAALEGDERIAVYYKEKAEKRAKAKAAREASGGAGKPPKKDKSKKAAVVPKSIHKDFKCEAHLITGVPCQSPNAASAIPAPATKHKGKRIATCKACKKTAKAAAVPSSSSQEDQDQVVEAQE